MVKILFFFHNLAYRYFLKPVRDYTLHDELQREIDETYQSFLSGTR